MDIRSTYSTDIDGYDAGYYIGEELKDIKPEIIIIHPSAHYADFTDLLSGLYDAVGYDDFILIGATGDGYYESESIGTHGVSAMGINSNNKIIWNISLEHNLSDDSYNTARKCAEKMLQNSKDEIKTALVFSDGVKGDGVLIVNGINSVFKKPFFGGGAGDSREFKKSFIFLNGKIYQNSIVILGIGGEFEFAVSSRSGWNPMGKAAKIGKIDGNRVLEIGEEKALSFVEKQLGYPLRGVDLRLFPLAVYDEKNNFFIREFLNWDYETGEIILAGSVKEGDLVRLTHATIPQIIDAVNIVTNDIKDIPFKPLGAFIISCAARKWILTERSDEERKRLFSLLGKKIPIVGFASFGEFGPIRNNETKNYTPTYFHNETYVISLFGIKL